MKISVIGCDTYYRVGQSYERAQLAASLEALGHTVYFHAIEPHQKRTDSIRSEMMGFKPDLCIFVPHEYEVDPSELRGLDFPIVLFLADDQWRREFGLEMAANCDYVMGNAPDSMTAYGAKSVPFEWAVFENVWGGDETARPHDVVFVAQHYGRRRDTVEEMREAGIDVLMRSSMPVSDMAALMRQSKIGLNLSRSSREDKLQVKIRPFETGASGAMILTEYAPCIEDSFIDGVEAVFFTTVDELIDKARYYLTHDTEREAIASAGKARVLRDHTLARRWEVLFKAVGLA